MKEYTAQSARDAQRSYSESYCDYLEQHAQELYAYFTARNEPEKAQEMLTRTLSEALMGNDGE